MKLGPDPVNQSAYAGCTQEPSFDYSNSTSAKNQLTASGFAYDAAGNLTTSPGAGTVTYNAENQLTYAQGQTYLYDGDGKRVAKATGSPVTPVKLYWYGTDDSPVLETDGAGNELDRYFRFQGILVTREESNDWVDHYGVDALGNVRWMYGYNGQWDISDYYPFGGERVIQSSSNNSRKFTGKERDSESGLDNFGARYDSPSLGRFISPDPTGGMRLIPQSLNRYAYVLNNPLRFVDPHGLWHCDWGNGESDDTQANGGASEAECKDQGGARWVNDEGDIEGISAGGISFCLNDCDSDLQNSSLQNLGAGSASLIQEGNSLSDEDDPIRALFTNNARCPHCANLFKSTSDNINLISGVYAAGWGGVVAAPTVLPAAANAIGAGVGWTQGTLGSGAGVLLGKFFSEADNYAIDAEQMGANYFNLGKNGWKVLNYFGDAWTANQAFIDASIARGQQFFLNQAPLGEFMTGTYTREVQYLFQAGVPNSQITLVW